jgi:hypothetical protein
VPFQESKNVDAATLAQRGVKPYGPPVDVWAAGVLAYELVCGRCACGCVCVCVCVPCRRGMSVPVGAHALLTRSPQQQLPASAAQLAALHHTTATAATQAAV